MTTKAPRKSRGSTRAKLGLPAKAGRRKVYAPDSKRKAKDWSGGTGFVMSSMDGSAPYNNRVFNPKQSGKQPVFVPRDVGGVQNSRKLTDEEVHRRVCAVRQANQTD